MQRTTETKTFQNNIKKKYRKQMKKYRKQMKKYRKQMKKIEIKWTNICRKKIKKYRKQRKN